jgi:hypothetical protein
MVLPVRVLTTVMMSVMMTQTELVIITLTDLHASTKTKDQVKGRLLLDIVIRKSATVLKLLAGKDQALLIRRNSFLVLNL